MVTCRDVRTREHRNTNDGRGAGDIARQVKAETGSTQTVAELEAELSEIVRAWKEETYPTAWEYMCNCAAAVYDPGYLINPWGRKRRFMINPGDNRADMERQAQNFPRLLDRGSKTG